MSNFQVAYNLIDSLASGSKLTFEEFMLLLEAYQSDRGNDVSRYARNKAAGDSIGGLPDITTVSPDLSLERIRSVSLEIVTLS